MYELALTGPACLLIGILRTGAACTAKVAHRHAAVRSKVRIMAALIRGPRVQVKSLRRFKDGSYTV
ncbi:hypothetical protein AG1IA_08781 [Rhizoctonia solani AG-1 IA]|uniref:Secreted protein n=1 Tax=Thanatephorus cucumeris (strain AG1-IA) TaxID=983506 RepID=L8WK49_THACA|nr:hypothetical protein AG1IA_08781 [Rhizoctonia solani AG-1 IA]